MRVQDRSTFFDFRWGVERETHRILSDGRLSPEKHPRTLQKPFFTLDFAESQLEIVTQPATSIPTLMSELEGLTDWAQRTIEPELLWPFSMPPKLPASSQITLADLDRRATLYREGLALRYGTSRQMICGLHVNVSFGSHMTAWLSQVAPLTKEEDSFELRLARNLYQELPHLVLLFSASPVQEGSEHLAISHRNGPSGYAGADFLPYLNLDSVEAYVAGIRSGLRAESTNFAALGLVDEGRVIQLNGKVMQSEREFYAPIRIRQVALPHETSLQALSRRGPGYLELRFFDIDPFHIAGVSGDTLRMLHLFLLDALVRPSLPRDKDALGKDLREAAEAAMIHPLQGLKDARFARLERRLFELKDWVRLMDIVERKETYARVLRSFRARAAAPHLLPSPTIARLFRGSGSDWTHFGIHTARLHRQGAKYAIEYARV